MIREDDTRYRNGRDDFEANKNASFLRRFFLTGRGNTAGGQESRKGTVRLLDRGEISYPPPKLAVEDALRFIDAQQGRTRTRQRLPTRR